MSSIKRNRWFGRLGRRLTGFRRNKRGLALVIALSILALLVLLGTAFALSAIYSAEGARMAGQIIKTRLMMESATQDAISVMSLAYNDPDESGNMMPATKRKLYDGGGAQVTELNKFGSNDINSVWKGRIYWSSLGDDDAGLGNAFYHEIDGVAITPSAGTMLTGGTEGWVHSQDSEGSSAITARYAYLVIDESGQVDVNAAISDTLAEGGETSTRFGKSASEVSLVSVLGTSASAFAASFQRAGLGSGQLPVGLSWLSWHHVFSQNTLATSNAAQINTPGIFPFSQEIEAYYDGGTDYHRYNLARTDWDSFGNSVTASKLTSPSAEYWANEKRTSVATNDGGISWLSGGTTQHNQIAANVIDFADSDSTATTDDAANPTYVGLEKVPYLNEVFFSASVSGGSLVVTGWVELVNVYDVALGSGGKITINYDATYGGGTTLANQSLTWSSIGNVAAGRYGLTASANNVTALSGSPATISGLQFTNVTVKLTDSSGNLWDFAHLPDSETSGGINSTPEQNSVEVNDPRVNTLPESWAWVGWGDAGTGQYRNYNCTAPTPGDLNDSEVTNYMGPDPTVDATPNPAVSISTAYIRNATFNSLWQLGCIHRGSAWQTLNLKTYPADDYPGRDEMDSYLDGDGPMLDQVKLSDSVEAIGKVNVNTYSQRTLRGLLENLTLSGNYGNPTGSGTVINTTIANSVMGTPGSLTAGKWLYENGSEGTYGRAFRSRAELARVVALRDGTVSNSQDTDAEQEELIGKLAALSTTRSNFFTLIMVAQTVKDLPTGVKGGTRGEFDEGIDRILAEQRVRMIIRRDAYRNELDVVRYDLFID